MIGKWVVATCCAMLGVPGTVAILGSLGTMAETGWANPFGWMLVYCGLVTAVLWFGATNYAIHYPSKKLERDQDRDPRGDLH